MIDVTGKEIVEGNLVVYAARRGSMVWLERKRVLRVDPGKGLVLQNTKQITDEQGNTAYQLDGKPHYYKSMSNMAVIA